MGGETNAAEVAEFQAILSGCNRTNLDDPANGAKPIAAKRPHKKTSLGPIPNFPILREADLA